MDSSLEKSNGKPGHIQCYAAILAELVIVAHFVDCLACYEQKY
jgi:hypothetical protein